MPSEKPNILFFHVDNLGMGELGCYGGGILRGADTKRTDKFATEGAKLTHYVVEPQCTPTRSALMTGPRSAPATTPLHWVAMRVASCDGRKPSPKFCPKLGTPRHASASGTSGRKMDAGRPITALTNGTGRCAPMMNACGSKTPTTFRSATVTPICTRAARAKV